MSAFGRFTSQFWAILGDSAFWLLLGMGLAAAISGPLWPRIHKVLKTNSGFWTILLLGAALPVCSCGVLPLSLALRRKGVQAGTILAFTLASPAINPIALIAGSHLVGPGIILIQVVVVILCCLVLRTLGNRLDTEAGVRLDLPHSDRGYLSQLLHTAGELAPYLLLGFALTALTALWIPFWRVQAILSTAHWWNLGPATLMTMTLYICSIGALPLLHYLLSVGAFPGIAILLLLAGPATNMGQLVFLTRFFSLRLAVIYLMVVLGGSLGGALFTNWVGGILSLAPRLIDGGALHKEPIWGFLLLLLLLIGLLGARRESTHTHCHH